MAFGDDEIAAAGRYLGMQYSWGGGDYDGPTKGIPDGGVVNEAQRGRGACAARGEGLLVTRTPALIPRSHFPLRP